MKITKASNNLIELIKKFEGFSKIFKNKYIAKKSKFKSKRYYDRVRI